MICSAEILWNGTFDHLLCHLNQFYTANCPECAAHKSTLSLIAPVRVTHPHHSLIISLLLPQSNRDVTTMSSHTQVLTQTHSVQKHTSSFVLSFCSEFFYKTSIPVLLVNSFSWLVNTALPNPQKQSKLHMTLRLELLSVRSCFSCVTTDTSWALKMGQSEGTCTGEGSANLLYAPLLMGNVYLSLLSSCSFS